MLLAAGCVTNMSREDLAAEYYNLGNGFYALKKYDRAIRYYELALDRSPDVEQARWNLALAYYQSGRYDAAQEILASWLVRDPESIEARELLALVYRGQGKPVEALATLEEVLGRAPESTRALNNRAVILRELGRLSEASETLRRYLTYEPYNPGALYDLSILSEEQGLTERARGYAEAYLAIAVDTESEADHVLQARYVLARAEERDEAYYRALEIYGEILEQDEGQAEAWFRRSAILLTSVEDPVRGYEDLKNALEKGYGNRDGIAALLAREDLQDRERVEDLLKDKSAYPPEEAIEKARSARLQDTHPVVEQPTGPWAEPGVDRPRDFLSEPQPPPAVETGP